MNYIILVQLLVSPVSNSSSLLQSYGVELSAPCMKKNYDVEYRVRLMQLL